MYEQSSGNIPQAALAAESANTQQAAMTAEQANRTAHELSLLRGASKPETYTGPLHIKAAPAIGTAVIEKPDFDSVESAAQDEGTTQHELVNATRETWGKPLLQPGEPVPAFDTNHRSGGLTLAELNAALAPRQSRNR